VSRLSALLQLLEGCDENARNTEDYEERERFYRSRNLYVWRAFSAASELGVCCGVSIDPEEAGWPVVYIELPTGQISYHVPPHVQAWDGHTRDDRRGRVSAFIETHPVRYGSCA